MLSNKKDMHVAFPLLKGLLPYRLLREVKYRGEIIGTNGIMFLVGVMDICGRTNEFARMRDIFRLLGVPKSGQAAERLIPPLLRLGLMERPGFGLFVLTNEGEYFLRDIETMFSRITKNTVRSKWRKVLDTETKAKYVRKKRVAGSKIVSIPVDDRQKLKHGLAPLRKNGKPRQINLPGSNPI